MSKLGTINGVPVISAARVPWKDADDEAVKGACDGRGLVLFDGGGKSDAIVMGDLAIIWERQGERFRAFPLPAYRPRQAKLGNAWSVAVPSSEIGSVVRVELDAAVTPDHPNGATIELTALGTVRYRAPLTHRELRRLLGVLVDWPGMAVRK